MVRGHDCGTPERALRAQGGRGRYLGKKLAPRQPLLVVYVLFSLLLLPLTFYRMGLHKGSRPGFKLTDQLSHITVRLRYGHTFHVQYDDTVSS